MKTLQEKYNAILENNFSKTQFVRDAKLQLPNYISPFNGYKDTVQILKNKGVIVEAKKTPAADLEKNYSLESIQRGVDVELEKMGIDTVGTVQKSDYEKAKAKVMKNLAKDCNFYLHLMSGDSKKVDKHDQMTPATAKNTVDTYNGLKKATLKESKKGKISEFSPHGTPAFEKGDKNSMSEHPKWDDLTADEIQDYIDANPTSLWGRSLSIAKMVMDKKKTNFKEMKHPSYPKATNQYQGKVDGLNHHKKLSPAGREEHRKSRQAWVKKMKAKGLFDLGEETLSSDQLSKKEIILKALNSAKSLEEGRARKIKGGKIVKEDDYGNGGYVESMGPRLEKAIKHLLAVWDEWKDGPMTEPGMIPHAKKDLVDYLASNLQEVEESVEEGTDNIEEASKSFDALVKRYVAKGLSLKNAKIRASQDRNASDRAAERSEEDAFGVYEENKVREQLKETFKKMITGILTEDRKLLKEARAENLERYINYENSDNEDLAARIRKGATDLADHIAKIEKTYLDTRQNIENIYTNISPFMAPAISAAFKKDLEPVLQKYRSIELPKTQVASPEQQEMIRQNPAGGEVNENKSPKRKYTKRKK